MITQTVILAEKYSRNRRKCRGRIFEPRSGSFQRNGNLLTQFKKLEQLYDDPPSLDVIVRRSGGTGMAHCCLNQIDSNDILIQSIVARMHAYTMTSKTVALTLHPSTQSYSTCRSVKGSW